jgi:hypothetical protein
VFTVRHSRYHAWPVEATAHSAKNISLLPGFAPTLRAGMRNYHMFIKEQEY